MLVGVLSDTHGDLHPGVVPLFRRAGVELILHAGDVGRYEVIDELQNLAPVRAVRGNVDRSGKVSRLPERLRLELAGVDILMTHIGGKPAEWSPRLGAQRPQVAICGHSHAPLMEERDGTLFLNPGAAGTRRRFSLPICAAVFVVDAGGAHAEIINLDVAVDQQHGVETNLGAPYWKASTER